MHAKCALPEPVRLRSSSLLSSLGLTLLLLLGLACGARTDPGGKGQGVGAYGAGDGGSAGAGGGQEPPVGDCQLCTGTVECSHCYIQAYEDTFRCPPGVPMPGSSCWGLDEVHVDKQGVVFTCYYCP